MGIKEDIEAIKQDIVGEEQFFEQYVKAEKFFKKYKEKLKALTMIATAFATYFIITNSLEANRIEKTNALYLEYSQSKNKTTLSKIKNISPKLYDLILLKDAIKNKDLKVLQELKNSKTVFVAKLASYHLASISEKEEELNAYLLKEGALLKDFASLNLAFVLIQNKKFEKAQKVIDSIAFDSPLKKPATTLLHFGIVKH
jgi:predicted negative regulator of RcsB-dependent stress response